MSRILAALHAQDDDDDPVNVDFLQPDALAGNKRRWDDQTGPGPSSTPGSGNKRRASGTPREQLNRLPSGLLASTQSSDTRIRLDPGGDVYNARALLSSSPLVLGSAGTFQLNYDKESSLTQFDIGGPDQQERLAEFVSKSIDNLSSGLLVRDGMEYLGLKDAKDLLPGMEVRLIPHQIIGVTWMLIQEKESQYKGGILADDMGLGKTVQMIATMAMNMPDVNDTIRATLIVVPAALLQQWKEELEAKTNGLFNVHIHHGKDKLKTVSAMRSKDVIITTYQTLNLEFVVKDPDVEEDEHLKWLQQYGGPLARMKWRRVVLDEAQFIRNRATRSSKTVAQLRSKYRWLLTGTPVTNTLSDIYGLIRFGHFRPWNDWESFDKYICKMQIDDPPLAGLRAQEVLKPIMLRRKKDAQLEGKPLLTLPPKSIEIVTLDFSSDERELYDNFEKRAKIRIGKFIRENTILKNHAAVLVMILRLRQLCCHPNLILSQTEGFEDPSLLLGSDADKELGRAKRIMGPAWVDKIKQRALEHARAVELDFTDEGSEDDMTCPVCGDMFFNDTGRVLTCGHEICFECLLNLREAPIVHDGQFGYGNEQQNLRVEKDFEHAEAKGLRPCPTCKKMCDFSPNLVFNLSAFEPSEDEMKAYVRAERERSKKKKANAETADPLEFSSLMDTTTTRKKEFSGNLSDLSSDDDDDMPDIATLLKTVGEKGKKKQRMINLDESTDDEQPPSSSRARTSSPNSNEHDSPAEGKGKTIRREGSAGAATASMIATWRREDDVEPSAKMLAMIDALKEAETHGDKTIVYSQWTSMLDLVETLFARYGIQTLRYDGKMSREARDRTLVDFRRAGSPKVILISTKCGSVGLNLVTANRVINLDLSWNYAAESQAYDRVHRLGQEKDVFVKRLVVKNTIEERMLRLQDLKIGLSDAALGEGTGMKLHKMSVKEIKLLFGMTPAQRPAAQSSSQQVLDNIYPQTA